MGRYTTASKAWVGWLAFAAVAATLLRGLPTDATPADWLALALFAVCGAVVHLFPIKSALGGATFTLTNVFLIGGAAILPTSLLTPLAILALTPERWRRRGRPGLLIGWVFNVSQSTVALHVAGFWVQSAGVGNPADPRNLLVLLVGAVVFTLVQDILVGVMIGLQSGASIRNTDTFRLPALLSDGMLALVGVIFACLWLTAPMFLMLLPPLLFMMFRLTRTAHLAHMAELDVKTGLHNYRHFERTLEDELARSQRAGQPLAVLFTDLDHFKQVNDRYGHAVGDRVLLQTANLHTAALRRTDLVARFGGEEFVALLPGTDVDEALQLAERVRAAIESHEFDAGEGGPTLRCTISVGVAVAPGDGSDPITLMKNADHALYQAKRTRNAVGQRAAAVERSTVETTQVEVTPPRATALPVKASAILWAVVACGLILAAASTLQIQRLDIWTAALPLILLTVASEFLGVRIYEAGRDRISFSLSAAATMIAVTALPPAAPLVSLAGSMVHALRARRRDAPRTLFNLANPPFAAAAAAIAYLALRPIGQDLGFSHLLAGSVAAITFYLFNSGLVAVLVSMSTRRSLIDVLRESGWSAPINVFLCLTGAFIGDAHPVLGPVGTFVFVVPVLMMRLTLDLYSKRSQRAITTLQALNTQLETEITQRKRFEASLEHQALHDPLTNFPNRSYLLERIAESTSGAEDDAEPFALLLLDLDRFKEINDTFGHQCGDLLLLQVAQRLRDRLRSDDTIARLGGDEFGVLLPGAKADGAVKAARVILEALEQPLILEGQELEVHASIGIALSPEHGRDPDVLMRRADVAMYVAKRGHTRLAVYDAAQDQHSPARLQLVGELRRAIEGDGLILHYQPKTSLRSGEMVGCEALVRWVHPQRGLIPPDDFVPLAENTGLIRPLSRWVLDAGLRQCRKWQDQGHFVPVSINLSARDLLDPLIPDLVASLLLRWDVAPNSLKLEITESAVMADAERAIDVLARLLSMGVRISVDDFGTGYSSLAYLKRLPVDELKIDRSFVRHLASDDNDLAIVRSTIGLAHDLGLTVVAEGVEDRATWEVLARLGCDVAQGYFVSRPVDADGLVAWLRRADDDRGRHLAA